MTTDKLVKTLRANDALVDDAWNGHYENKWCSGPCLMLACAFRKAHHNRGQLVYITSSREWAGILHVVYYYRGWYYDGDGIYRNEDALLSHWQEWEGGFGKLATQRGLYDRARRQIHYDKEVIDKIAQLLETIV